MSTNKKLYVAYGANMNARDMSYRCPNAAKLGVGYIKDYKLEFRGVHGLVYATIAPKRGREVPAVLWEISERDERELDSFEYYPTLYRKALVLVLFNGETVEAMAYIMGAPYNKKEKGTPSRSYFETIYKAYDAEGIDTKPLFRAMGKKGWGKDYVAAFHNRFKNT